MMSREYVDDIEKKKATSSFKPLDEVDEVSSSTFGSFRSPTSSSVPEYKWLPCKEIEEYDEGWDRSSRTSSSISSFSPNSNTAPRSHRQGPQPGILNWWKRLLIPAGITRKPTSAAPVVDQPQAKAYIGRSAAPVVDQPQPTNEIESPFPSRLHLQSSPLLQQTNSRRLSPFAKNPSDFEFFTEYGDANRYKILEVIGKGSYGLVCSAIDTQTGEKVAIKKMHDIFEDMSDPAQILREIKLLRLLRHPDIVEIKHIMSPPSRRDFRDIFVVFELMESDLHQVIKANDDLTKEHYQFFLYQLLRALKYIHTANVYHRDLKPKNILANANCKLKICDFGLARVAFNDTPSTIFWTDYVANRWYRAPELCGSFFSKYTPAIDIWSIGCVFAEVLTGKPLFPGKNIVHQLDLMTDLLGTPSLDTISRVQNEKARRYLSSMRKKPPVPLTQKFPNADPLAVKLLERLLAFDPKDRPTAEEALADPYFKGLSIVEREPSCQPITKLEFEFERRRVTKEDLRELIFREILEYHPQLLKDYLGEPEEAHL